MWWFVITLARGTIDVHDANSRAEMGTSRVESFQARPRTGDGETIGNGQESRAVEGYV
jgi:hypothetical protein